MTHCNLNDHIQSTDGYLKCYILRYKGRNDNTRVKFYRKFSKLIVFLKAIASLLFNAKIIFVFIISDKVFKNGPSKIL